MDHQHRTEAPNPGHNHTCVHIHLNRPHHNWLRKCALWWTFCMVFWKLFLAACDSQIVVFLSLASCHRFLRSCLPLPSAEWREGSAAAPVTTGANYPRGVTKRRNGWACRGNPNPEQETIKGTHTQETPAYQRRPTTQYAAQPSGLSHCAEKVLQKVQCLLAAAGSAPASCASRTHSTMVGWTWLSCCPANRGYKDEADSKARFFFRVRSV